jgi:hypothetical protein
MAYVVHLGSGRGRAYSDDDSKEEQREGEDDRHEEAVLGEVGLGGKQLPVGHRHLVEVLRRTHQSHCNPIINNIIIFNI